MTGRITTALYLTYAIGVAVCLEVAERARTVRADWRGLPTVSRWLVACAATWLWFVLLLLVATSTHAIQPDASGTMNVRNGAIGVKDNTIGPTQLDETATYTFSSVLGFSSSGTIDVPDSTVAGLGTATAGLVRRLSDGGAVGAPVLADGTQFECPEENTQKVRIVTCPPYNAKADGTTDDEAAIESAVASGATLYLPAGTYIIGTSSLLLNTSNLVVRGAGMGKTIIKMEDASNLDRTVLLQNCTNCTLMDLTIDQNSANQSANLRRGIETATSNTNITLERVELKGHAASGGNAFYGGGTLTGLTITDSRIVGGGVAGRMINIASGTRVRITNNVCTASSQPIGCTSCVDAVISGNTVDLITAAADNSVFCAGCTGVLMSNNVINGNTAGFDGGDLIGCFSGSTGVTIANNVLRNGSDNAIQVDDCTDVAVTGNAIISPKTNGISLLNGSEATITGNYIKNVGSGAIANEQAGIVLRAQAGAGEAKNITVTGNTIVDLQGSPTMQQGIWDRTTEAQQVTVGWNEIRGAVASSVDLSASTSVTQNFVASVSAGTALDVTGTAAPGWTATVAWDSTEVNDTTWGSAGDATIVWTFDPSTGVNPTIDISGTDVVFNEGGLDVNHRFEGDTESNLFVLDAGTERAGVGTVPSARFHVLASATGDVAWFGATATNDDPALRIVETRLATSGAASATADYALGSSKAYFIEVRTVARCQTGSSGCSVNQAGGWLTRALYRTSAGTPTEVNETNDYAQDEITGSIATPDLSVSGSNVRLTVTGLANQELVWHTTWLIQEVGT